MKKISLYLVSLVIFQCSSVWAWGGRGHHAICHHAVFLMKEKGLRDFFKARPQVLGHLCNTPDIHWKNQGGEQNRIGSPTHWLNPETIGLTLEKLPDDYKKIVKKYTGKPHKTEANKTLHNVPGELGSLWWRAEQFWKRGIAEGEKIGKSKPPVNKAEEQDTALPYNKALFGMMVNLGLMGHFVGDASMPFHSTIDHDGYLAGHGGIHWFYEDANVNEQDETFESKIIPEAKKLQALADSEVKSEREKVQFLIEKNPIERMRQLSIISVKEINPILEIDKVKVASEKPNKEGSLKKPAERLTAEETKAAMEPLIIQQLARSAALLAQFWDEAYTKAGRPDLTAYRSYQYPFTPEFVPPDYYDVHSGKKSEEKED